MGLRALSFPVLLMTIVGTGHLEKVARTGQEFRKLNPALRSVGKLYRRASPTYRFLGSLADQRFAENRLAGYHLLNFGGTFFPVRRTPPMHIRRHAQQTRRHAGKADKFGARNRHISRQLAARRRNARRTTVRRLSLQQQYHFNKCKSVKKGKCCKGWKKHPLTGYCMPVCSDFCVHGTCMNEYVCECHPGFQGPLCDIDVNECSQEVCHHGCLNTYGSYRCICNRGYELENDGKCHKIHPCVTKKCQHRCYLDGNEPKCICPKGFQVAKDGRTCIDIDECRERNVRCDHDERFRSCKNLPGSYACTCKDGYFYHRRIKNCQDSNECLLGAHNCNDTSSQCLNTEGSFRCQCKENFIADGNICVPSDRTEEASICHENAEKVSAYSGDGECVCNTGYIGDGIICRRL